MKTAVDVAIVKDQKILLVKKKNTWILPGGKLEENETDLECLLRELDEELPGLTIKDIKFYKTFEGKTPHKNYSIQVKVYLAKIDSELYNTREGDSISDAIWTNDFSKYNLSEITSKIVESLIADNYIKNANLK